MRLHNVAPRQELCHDGLDVKHGRAIDRVEPGKVKLNAFDSEYPTGRTSKPIGPVLCALRKNACERPVPVAARMASAHYDAGRIDAVETVENFNMGEFTQPKKRIGGESLSQPNRRSFEVPGIVYGLRSGARDVADWLNGELQNAPP